MWCGHVANCSTHIHKRSCKSTVYTQNVALGSDSITYKEAVQDVSLILDVRTGFCNFVDMFMIYRVVVMANLTLHTGGVGNSDISKAKNFPYQTSIRVVVPYRGAPVHSLGGLVCVLQLDPLQTSGSRRERQER
ncbi:hypothetical protein KC19_3G177700 [Ceratodon purpureus]|uniref:Uncharacterized protein n=1 Tax=Ceratodon purpureus TaxID=3225 RepID=A0A8T0IN42_CERPU|nr:hypothetical protein KC19_3G177700 [Ceratodon purpureus]